MSDREPLSSGANRPLLLDLFCGAGGAAVGFHRAGFEVVGVDLIPATRELLEASGLPYVIENVEKARPELRNPAMFCGSSFGLGVRRHRLFETNWPLLAPPCCHFEQIAAGKQYPGATNREGRYTCEIGVWRIPLDAQKRAMGVDWDVTLPELSQMVPPAYTESVGWQLRAYFETKWQPDDDPDCGSCSCVVACEGRP